MNASFDQPAGAELLGYNVDFARGFAFDPRAAAGRCTASQARAAACPVSSKIGGGTGQLSVAGHSLARTQFTVAISFFIMRPQRRGDVAGLVLAAREPKSGVNLALVGRLVHVARGTYGLELRFSNTAGELPRGLQVQLRHVHVVFGTQRIVAMHTGRRATHVTYHLLTNPRSCPRSGWPLLLTVSYSTGTEHYLGRAACTAAR